MKDKCLNTIYSQVILHLLVLEKARSNKALLKKYRQITACPREKRKLILEKSCPQTSVKEGDKAKEKGIKNNSTETT